MERLAKVDSSFHEYLKRKGLNLKKKLADDDMRAKTLRKINGIVIVREAFRKKAGARSRKNPTTYTGASAFFSICESNPRLLIGLLNQLLGAKDKSDHPVEKQELLRITPDKQAKVFSSAAARFRAYLRTIPSPKVGRKNSRGLLSLVDEIGNYFHGEVVSGEFDDDPDTSFVVDANGSDELYEALQRALNAGAIIWVPDKSDNTLLTSLNGKRFRLTYLLAPYHQLPLQLGRSISLRKILEPQKASEGPYLFDVREEGS